MLDLLKIVLCWLLASTLYQTLMVVKTQNRFTARRISTNFKFKFISIVGICMIIIGVSISMLIPFMAILMVPLCVKIHQTTIKKHQQRMIQYYGYKIFKFLINQISSGILVSNAIQSMYLIVKDYKLRNKLIDVSAYYAQTSDLEQALDILRESYKGIEVETLCVAIEQGIHTGANYNTLLKMETLLFKKYIYQIKFETELRKKRGILAVLLLCMVIIMMVAIPIVIDIIGAFNQIFF